MAPMNPLDPKVGGEPWADHPRQRATDQSRMARIAEGWKLYQPIIEIVWKLGLPVLLFSWLTGLIKAPALASATARDLATEIARSTLADSLSIVDRRELRGEITEIKRRLQTTERASCIPLDVVSRAWAECPTNLPPARP